MSVRVKLSEVDPFAGGIVFQLTHLENEQLIMRVAKVDLNFLRKTNIKHGIRN